MEGDIEKGGGRKEAMVLGRERQWRKGGLREGGLMKDTRGEGTGRGMDGGREEANGGGIERGREGEREQGNKEVKRQGRYPEEATDQYTVYSQTIPQRGPCQ